MIRVRFAPSPTGLLHIGGARTALFNYLFAKKNNGKYILRIEDTDIERSTKESVDNLIKSLKWLKLSWDEGPEIGGEYGPYFQTKRFDLYKKYLDKLIDEGKAYPCFCTTEELQKEREEQLEKGLPVKYSGKCRDLSPSEIKDKIDAGKPFAIRFKVPEKKKIRFKDLIHGDMEFDSDVLGDFVIMRSNGYPTYNYSVVIDDALMQITHVIRGDDHLSNTPKQVLLYEALGFPLPKFAHVSMILGADGTRLSKRHGATSVEEFEKQGYLPEALDNFLALLGWTPPAQDGKQEEIFSLDEISQMFSLEHVSKNPAIMNIDKLHWMNGIYLRKKTPQEILLLYPDILKNEFFNNDKEKALKYIKAMKDHFFTLNDIEEHIKDFTEWKLNKALIGSLDSNYLMLLKKLVKAVKSVDKLELKGVGNLFKHLSKEFNIKGKDLFIPMRYILSGKKEGAELQYFFIFLSKDELVKRIEKAIEAFEE